ncbi:MAG: UDP-2,3-diacylglucosamine diphosphatase [Reichenbachiella sp.]|uniref:UDP-2,3-diacylglucosamine diphosphatase n=1 Tax=Reichenbachiella sp. TaxID=2184521 RepID=UPI003266A391
MNTRFAEIEKGKKIYFASDFHLGVPDPAQSKQREIKIVRWLDQISTDAQSIFLLGDTFDFWFEYKEAIPKGYNRLLGKLAELTDQGINIYLFTGNHDLWLGDYLTQEIGVEIIKRPVSFQLGGKRFYLAHGDGLGPGDSKFKFYKKIFTNPLCQWMFRWLHPDLGIALAKKWSKGSRLAQMSTPLTFHGEEEWLIIHSREVEKHDTHNYYIYGHRHIAGKHELNSTATYLNLGEWFNACTYAEYDGADVKLRDFSDES